MRLEQFYYLLSLEKTKSINATANILHISQQAISSSIKSLESELGVPLLIRTTKGVQLTECGYYALECGRTIADSLENMKRNIAQFQSSSARKPLTILLHSAFSLNSNNCIISFYNEFADYDLNIFICQNHTMLKKIVTHEADLALCCTFKQGLKEIKKAGLSYYKLDTYDYGVLLNKQSALAQNDVISLAEIVSRYPIMIFNDLESDNNSSNELIKKYNLQHLVKYTAVNVPSMQHMLKNDLAVTLGPQNINSKMMEKSSGDIDCKFIPLKESEPFYKIFFASPELDINIVKRFKKILKQLDI